MKELAPQTKDGSYSRPTYNLKGVIGSSEFPVGSSMELHSPISTIPRKSCTFLVDHAASTPGSSASGIVVCVVHLCSLLCNCSA